MPPIPALSDLNLLRQTQAGTASAFAALYRRHQGPLYRFALLPPQLVRIAVERARARTEGLRKEGKLPALERNDADGEQVLVKRVERTDADGQLRVREDVRVRIAAPRPGGEQGPMGNETTIHLGPTLAGAFGANKWAVQARVRRRQGDGQAA